MQRPELQNIKEYFQNLQISICQALEVADGKATFEIDNWEKNGVEGSTRIIRNGDIFEQGGVNFSHVKGSELPATASARYPELAGAEFEAMGVSLVIHPLNPYVPTTHANVRFFSSTKNGQTTWWFGGGMDLTPYYPFQEDCIHWHQVCLDACSPFGESVYPTYKKWCDDYFYLKHRNETRGIGGLFFDDLNQWPFEDCYAFTRSVGDHFVKAYVPIVERRKEHVYSEHEKAFQLYRRGRYVEFNLVYDRGTLFGLQSGGRTESILMSLPPNVQWRYNWQPEPGTKEAELYSHYLQPREWLEMQPKQEEALS